MRHSPNHKDLYVPASPLSRQVRGLTILGTALAALTLPGLAAAALGAQEASVADDAVAAHATIRMQQRLVYRQHEIVMDTGTVLREYVNAAGTVFAVTWKGPTLPNLKQTLGQYFEQYVATARLKVMPHRAVRVQETDLVIESSGHMRAFSGLAYVPSLMPAGVTAGDLT